jgi:hypothetical protein
LRHCLDVAYDAQAQYFDETVTEIFDEFGKPEAMVRHWSGFMGYVIQPCRNIPLIAVLRPARPRRLAGTCSNSSGPARAPPAPAATRRAPLAVAMSLALSLAAMARNVVTPLD